MITLWTVIIYVVAVATQAWLMWQIDRRAEEAKAEFLASLYTSLVVTGVFLALRLIRGDSTLPLDRYGFGAMFANYLLYTSVGLAAKPVEKLFTRYSLYSVLIGGSLCIFMWWVAIGSRTLQ